MSGQWLLPADKKHNQKSRTSFHSGADNNFESHTCKRANGVLLFRLE